MAIKILLVDDHSMITDFYKTSLEYLELDKEVIVKNTLESAFNFIFNEPNSILDIIVLDLSMPAYIEEKIANGADLAKTIRIKFPKIKIIIISGLFDIVQLDQIIQNTSPEGIVEKLDITSYDSFNKIIKEILKGKFYYSKIVEKTINDNPKFDVLNRKIITLLSQGIKTKNIPNHLFITLSAVNKRKSIIKQILKIDKGDNEDIVREAKRKGIIQ